MWHKAWLESQWRFAICMALLMLIFAADTYQADLNMPRMGILPNEFNKYIWKIYFTRFQLLWILSALVLSMGGLVSERATGSSDFSLSLPVSRRRWNAVRGGMAAAQVFLLAMAPVAVVPVVAGIIGKSYPVLEAANFSIVIFLTGLFILTLGLLYSSCFAGQYASVALGIATVFTLTVFVNPVAGRYPFLSMNPVRESSLNAMFFLADGSWPWFDALSRMVLAIILWEVSTRIIQKRDF
jgi:ABC-type transport system involved in multi-copper enzyme maturation permease subunit